MRLCLPALCALGLLLATPVLGEEALVLSGGGSRGLAHAGALVGIEERGHDPDLVVGTSMGAILGALYASGYSADSVRAIVLDQDWRAIFEPLALAIGPLRATRHPVLRLQGGVGGPLVTRGYIADWRVNRELVRLLFAPSARARGDFDRLPRRFRAIAADLDSAGLVSIASGDLARAVRASMAASGFFAPVRWESQVLFDGGVADYLAVAEARRLGAEHVIAVDALRPPLKPHSLDALAVARRTVDLLVVKVRSGDPDVLVLPKLDPALSPYDYPVDPTPIVQAGYRAALDTVPSTSEPPAIRPALPPPDSLGGLVILSTSSTVESFLRRAFRAYALGAYDSSRVLATVDRLYATGLFDGVWSSVEGDSARPGLAVQAETWGSVSFMGAPGYDNDRGGRIWGSLRALSASPVMPLELALEGSVDGVEQWAAATANAASLLRWVSSWTAGAFYGEWEQRFLEAKDDDGDPEVRRGGGWLGAEWRRFDPDLQAGIGLSSEYVVSDVGPDGGSFGPWLRVGMTPRFVEETGIPASLEAKLRFGDVDYWRARVRGSLRRRFDALSAAVVGDATGVSEDAPLDEVPAMGDEFLMPALRWGEHRARARAVAGVDLSYPAAFGASARLRLRGGAIIDELDAELGAYGSDTRWIGGAGLSLLWWIFLGKVEVGVEAGTLGDRRLVVNVGPSF